MIHHRSPISGIATYQDRFVATAGYDNQVILWDAAAKNALARVCHDHLANQCTFSSDGKYLASASSDYSARIWSVPDLRLQAICRDHEDDVEMVAFHPSEPLLATASRDHLVRVFGLDGEIERVLTGHDADVISVDWIRGTNILVSSSDDGTIRRWDVEAGKLVGNIDMQGVETDTIAISPSGVIFGGNDEGDIAIIRGGSVQKIKAHEAGIKRLAFDPVSSRLLSISYDRTFKLWNVSDDGEPTLALVADLPSVLWPRSCAFQGTDKIVFGTFGTRYATFDLTARKMSTEGVDPTWGFNAVASFRGDRYAIGDAGVVFKNGARAKDLGSLCNFLTPFSDLILTGGQMGILFDAVSGRTLHQHRSPLNCAAVISNGGIKRAIVGAYTGEGLIFRIGPAGFELEQTIQLHPNAIKGVACSGGLIFSVCATGAAAFHSAQDGQKIKELRVAHEKIANGCAALADGRFASISRDLRLRIWKDGVAKSFASPLVHSIKCIAASESGRWLGLGSYDGTVAVFDTAAECWIHIERPTASGISSLCADGEAFLASSYDGQVYRVRSHSCAPSLAA